MESMAKPIHAALFLISIFHSCKGFSTNCPVIRKEYQSALHVSESIQQLHCPLGRYSLTRSFIGGGMKSTFFCLPLLALCLSRPPPSPHSLAPVCRPLLRSLPSASLVPPFLFPSPVGPLVLPAHPPCSHPAALQRLCSPAAAAAAAAAAARAGGT
jgi:hypothetical protein